MVKGDHFLYIEEFAQRCIVKGHWIIYVDAVVRLRRFVVLNGVGPG